MTSRIDALEKGDREIAPEARKVYIAPLHAGAGKRVVPDTGGDPHAGPVPAPGGLNHETRHNRHDAVGCPYWKLDDSIDPECER